MDAATNFIADVTVALVAGSLAGLAARALGITPVIGYIVAGIIIGPFTPGYVAHAPNLSGLAELGLIFLLFSLGLGFSVDDLLGNGMTALVANLIAMGCIAAAVWFVAARFGIPHPTTLALAFTISSTAVGAALLQAVGLVRKRVGHIALSLLIIQDLLAVIILVIVSAPANSMSVAGIALPLVRAIAFVAIALVLGATLLHRLFRVVLLRASTELLVGVFSAVALGAAWLGHAAGLTFEFGAFVAGAVTSEAAGSRMVQNIVRPFRELFIMMFFVSMGTFVDVSSIFVNWRSVVVVATVAIIARWLLFGGVGRLMGLPTAASVALGIALVPMGEFNIVLGNASLSAGRLNRAEMGVLVGASMISILVSAILARVGGKQLARADGIRAHVHVGLRGASIVLIGYGRVGQTAASMFAQREIDVLVVEQDAALVRLAQSRGLEAAYGDGSDPHVLEAAVTSETRAVLLTVPDSAINVQIVRWLHAHDVHSIVTRAEHAADVRRLLESGAAAALVPEIEAAAAFGRAVLDQLDGIGSSQATNSSSKGP